jgi:hypothetical protein
VPTCSRPRESTFTPPSPTQKAAELSGRLQTTRGCTQRARTAVKPGSERAT